jgi:uncharacterized protein (TIGR02001 family)
MRISLFAAAGLVWLAPTPAAAQIQLSGAAEIVSDYRYRGASLSNGKSALQASIEAEQGGFYLGGFGSWVPKGGGSGAVELDLSAGHRTALDARLTLEGGIAYYHYPQAQGCDYAEAIAALDWERGETSARAGFAYAPRQPGLRDATGAAGDNLYGFVAVEQGIAGTPLSLRAEAGYESGAFDGAERGGKLDWRAGVTLSRGAYHASAHYIGALRPRAVDGERRIERGLAFVLGRSF